MAQNSRWFAHVIPVFAIKRHGELFEREAGLFAGEPSTHGPAGIGFVSDYQFHSPHSLAESAFRAKAGICHILIFAMI